MVDPVTVITVITGIISAFNSSVDIYQSWREKRRERRANPENQNLERSLVRGKTTVQGEYDENFRRLGDRFAIGDDRARLELSQFVVKLQNIIITMMAESTSHNQAIVLPSLPQMLFESESMRTGVVRALGEQYQRMLQTRPLNRSPLPLPPPSPSESSSLGYPQYDTSPTRWNPPFCSGDVDNVSPLLAAPGFVTSCNCCNYKIYCPGKQYILSLKGFGRCKITEQSVRTWHTRGNPDGRTWYRCRLCKTGFQSHTEHTFASLVSHLEFEHNMQALREEIVDDLVKCTCLSVLGMGISKGIWNKEEHRAWCPTRNTHNAQKAENRLAPSRSWYQLQE